MTKVVSLATYKEPKPKVISGNHHEHRYTVTFDPNAPPHEQWVWHVYFRRTYEFFDTCATSEQGVKQALRQIHGLITRNEEWDEDGK